MTSSMPKQSELIVELIHTVKKLSEDLEAFKASQIINQPILNGAPRDTIPVFPVPETPPLSEVPVPLDYRQVIEHTLNKNFGVRIQPMTDAPAFLLSIIVPDTYSPMTPSQRQVMKEDIRPKVISQADGTNGVRLWAEKVYANFNPETQARIATDRI